MSADAGAAAEMPRYRCHKEVWALKIAKIEVDSLGDALIYSTDERYGPIKVEAAFVGKHVPTPGGYYVVYKDGYKSFSPADAFEEGYTRI